MCTVAEKVKWYNHYRKQYGDYSNNEKQNCHIIQQSQFWVHNKKKPKAGSWKHTCTTMFFAALFTIVKRLLQSDVHWKIRIKKMWYIHMIRYYLVFKKEILLHPTTYNEPQGHPAKWNKPVTKRHILSNFTYERYIK